MDRDIPPEEPKEIQIELISVSVDKFGNLDIWATDKNHIIKDTLIQKHLETNLYDVQSVGKEEVIFNLYDEDNIFLQTKTVNIVELIKENYE